MNANGPGAPSPWVERWLALVPTDGLVLDLACGRGRHALAARRRGLRVVAVDRDEVALRSLPIDDGVSPLCVDLEAGPWPFVDEAFACVVVTNYLWRPLLPRIVEAVAPGGLLVYETFLVGHERFGRPTNPDFLLRPGELRAAVAGALDVLGFEEGPDGDPPVAMRQRLAARRPQSTEVGRGSTEGADCPRR